MGKFIVEPHFRLQEWVAEEKGYFRAEGLDYEFRELIRSTAGQHHNKGASGAFQSIEKGREADVSCACHWTVAVAASNGHARLYADAYSVAPAGIFVPADSPIRTPADLAGVPISVGFQSGSHYSTIQALEQYLKRDQINLTFEDGMLFRRLELLIDGKSRAAALFSGPRLTTSARSGLPDDLRPARTPAASKPDAAVTLTAPLHSREVRSSRAARVRCWPTGSRRPPCPSRGCRSRSRPRPVPPAHRTSAR